jgi:uncharacterized protein YjiS (DUF1127 family)
MTQTLTARAARFFTLFRSWTHDAALSAYAALAAFGNRRAAAFQLAHFDRRMLADIGLTPEDVGAAFSEPLWRDPTRRLAVLAVERRVADRASRHDRHTGTAVAETQLETCAA